MKLIRPVLLFVGAWVALNFAGPPLIDGAFNIYGAILWLLLAVAVVEIVSTLYFGPFG